MLTDKLRNDADALNSIYTVAHQVWEETYVEQTFHLALIQDVFLFLSRVWLEKKGCVPTGVKGAGEVGKLSV